jgi:imidazolonepropionase-like amidohydrolase
VLSHATLLPYEGEDLSQASYKNKPPIDYARFAGENDPVMATLFAEMGARGTMLDATASLWTGRGADPGDEDQNLSDLSVHLTRQAHRAGVEITTGSDYETAADRTWPSLIEEMLFLNHECGISAPDVIRAATESAARSAGALGDMGTLTPGKLANFVAVNGDPGSDLTRLRSPHCTVKRGHPHFAKA